MPITDFDFALLRCVMSMNLFVDVERILLSYMGFDRGKDQFVVEESSQCTVLQGVETQGCKLYNWSK